MKIKSLMIPNPITITDVASITDAIEIMKINSIRHLPVVSKSNLLKGFVTLADLKQGLIPSMVADLTLSDLMIKDPITVDPDEDIEVAAQLIYKHKIGGMPVVKRGKVVGIITESDILRAFIDMMGILTSSSRIDVVIGREPGSMKKALLIIHDNGGEIINVGMTAQHTQKRIYYFRLAACKTAALKDALEKEGYEVVAAMD
ncbi:MAG: CBS and ACT domain-containing protein [Pseudomonadota bacterium]